MEKSKMSTKEVGILFQGPMVRAILEGRKTQTRRNLKEGIPIGNWEETAKRLPWKIGDYLYVRETWWDHGQWVKIDDVWGWSSSGIAPLYDTENHEIVVTKKRIGYPKGWRKMSSLHLPKKHSRIWLKVTNVRVERLLDISDDDAISEGIDCIDRPSGGDDYIDYYRDYMQPKEGKDGWPWIEGYPNKSYFSLWDKINGAGSHKENPWCVVIEFERVEKP